MQGKAWSESQAVDTFLHDTQDPDFKAVVMVLMASSIPNNLNTCITSVQKHNNNLKAKSLQHKMLKAFERRVTNRKRKRDKSNDGTSPRPRNRSQRATQLPKILTTISDGTIEIPKDQFLKLSKAEKKKINVHNKLIKKGVEIKDWKWPEGVKIGS